MEKTEKIKKEYLRRTIKLLENELYRRNLNKEINTWAVPLRKIVRTILKVDERRTPINGLENKKIYDDA